MLPGAALGTWLGYLLANVLKPALISMGGRKSKTKATSRLARFIIPAGEDTTEKFIIWQLAISKIPNTQER